jgi:hypothetical protein
MSVRNLAVLFAFAAAVASGYTYSYTDTFSTINTTQWYQNGSVSGSTGPLGPQGLIAPGSNNGSVLWKGLSASEGDVRQTITLAGSGGVYVDYLRASQDALTGTGGSGSYYAAELQNPTFVGSACSATLAVYKSSGGVITTIGSTTVVCHTGMTMRFVCSNTQLGVYIDNIWQFWAVDSSPPPAGYEGVGARGTPQWSAIAKGEIGAAVHLTPNTIDPTTVSTSLLPNNVQAQWKNVANTGTGVMMYQVLRGGVFEGNYQINPGFSDPNVTAATTYTYSVTTFDFHYNQSAAVPFTIKTPPAGAIDPRQAGVRPTGTYWGGGGENIDMRSGNLNFTVPLVKAMGRGSWGATFALSYNSQLWRKDWTSISPNYAVWKLGEDVGYGFGWKLQAGSLRGFYATTYAVDHYLFTDATGAEYRLTVNNSGVWSSTEGIYVQYDSNANRLYFRDGSFWVMGDTSGGTEDDAGTMYPTTMEDTNGNSLS